VHDRIDGKIHLSQGPRYTGKFTNGLLAIVTVLFDIICNFLHQNKRGRSSESSDFK